MEVHLGIVLGIDETFVFVTPYDHIQEFWEERLWQVPFLGVRNAIVYLAEMLSLGRQDLLILMDTDKIEPILFLCAWLEEFDISSFKGSMEPLISHVTQAI